MKNICFKLFIVYFLLSILFLFNAAFADGKNDLIYEVANESVIVRRNNTVAVFGDSRLSNALYSIPEYRSVTYYTFEGFNFDDMTYFITGMYKQDPTVYKDKLHNDKLLLRVNLDYIDRMYDSFLRECKNYDKIIVQIGINSIQEDSTRFQAKYMQFLNLLHDKCKNAKMYLAKYFGFSSSFPEYVYHNGKVKYINDTIDKLRNYYDFIDVISGKMTFVTDYNTYQVKEGYSTDGIHLDRHLDEYYSYVVSLFEEAGVPFT